MAVFTRNVAVVAIACAMVFSAVPVGITSAHAGHDHAQDGRIEPQTATGTHDNDNKAGKRLPQDRRRACERRETAIINSMSRSRERAERHIELFTTIADRTKAFYSAQGKTVANYTELVSAVDAAKVKAEASLSAMPDPGGFNCSGEDPKGSGKVFTTALKQTTEDLKAYKIAVKGLVAGVKSAQSPGAN